MKQRIEEKLRQAAYMEDAAVRTVREERTAAKMEYSVAKTEAPERFAQVVKLRTAAHLENEQYNSLIEALKSWRKDYFSNQFITNPWPLIENEISRRF